MRKRTAVVIGGVESLRVNAADGRISPGMRLTSQVSYSIESPSFALSLGAGAAIAPDGYFLTAAHAVSLQPSHVLVEATGGVVAAPVRVVWSDSGADVALVHAAVAPDSWFEWMPDRPITRGGPVVAFAHLLGGSAGAVEVRIDFEEIGPYEVVAIPHDAPLRSGFSGGPAIALDGSLIGILTSTGKDTLFKRRGWITRPSPEFVARLVEADRRSRRSTAGSAPPR
jgi:S1-C subfamily serine protease